MTKCVVGIYLSLLYTVNNHKNNRWCIHVFYMQLIICQMVVGGVTIPQ